MILLAQIDPNTTTPYLILGYVIMTLIGLAYIVFLVSRQQNLKRDIELLQRLLEKNEEND